MTSFSFIRVFAVLAKEFTQLTRDRLTYAMMLAVPVIQLTLFAAAINNNPQHLPTAVYVSDQSTLTRSVLAALKNSGYFDVVRSARSPSELDRLVARGVVQFAVTIPPDFTRRVVRGDHAQILVEADASDPAATGSAVGALAGLSTSALSHDLVGAVAAVGKGQAPFEVVIHRRYNPENVSAYNVVPGLLGIVLTMTLVMMTALGVTREHERGTMESLLATPVQPIEVMIGKLTPYVGIGSVQVLVILTLARGVFNVPMAESWASWGALSVGVVLFIIGSLALGFLISTLAKTQLQAMQLSVFYFLPSFLLSGFAFPFRGMPAWAQAIGSIIPVTHFLRIVRGALLKNLSFADLGASMSALVIFVAAVVALAMLRYRRTLD